MRKSLFLAVAALALCIIVSAPGYAVLIGTPGQDNNGFPFGGSLPGYPGSEYQQVYNQSLFPVMDITSITFFNSFSGYLDGATYQIYLSVTSKAVNGLDGTILYNNVTGTNVLFWTGDLSGNPGPTFSFSGPAFHYDPSQGNILIDIKRYGVSGESTGGSFDAMNGNFGTDSSRAHNFGPAGYDASFGLVTGFNYGVPLPPSVLLLGSGLLGLGAARYRYRKKS